MPGLTLTGVNHIGILTRDLDRAIRTWADDYGVGPWKAYTYTPDIMEMAIDGEPVKFGIRVGLAQLGPATRVEIIQPLDERGPYAASLREHDDADHLHHVRFDVADYDEAIAAGEGVGLRTTLKGRFHTQSPGLYSHATYFDTRNDLGVITELAKVVPSAEVRAPDYEYPAG